MIHHRNVKVFGTDGKSGDYAHALANGHTVHLLLAENTGALGRNIITLLKSLGKLARGPEGHDTTTYGTSRASPQTFFQHHLAAVSSTIVAADSLMIRNRAKYLHFAATHLRA